MSDQGRHDTDDHSDRPRTKRWEHDEKVDTYREGRRSVFVEAMEVLRAKGESGLAEWVKRVCSAYSKPPRGGE